jgi:hypothetical protein
MQISIMSDTPSISLGVSQNVESEGVHPEYILYCIIRHIKIHPSVWKFFLLISDTPKKRDFSQCWDTPPSPPAQYAGEPGSQEKGGRVLFLPAAKGKPISSG